MNSLVIFLLIVNIVLPFFIMLISSIKKGLIEINHVTLFSFGFLYYLVLPILVGVNGWFIDKPAMENWFAIFNGINDEKLSLYLFIINLMYLSFIIGSISIEKKKYSYIEKNKTMKNFYFSNKILNLFMIVLIVLTIFFIVKLRTYFFEGYTNTSNLLGSEKGSFIAFSLVIFSFSIIYSSKKNQHVSLNNEKVKFSELILNKFFLLYLFVSFLVLSMGGRLYFASGVFSILVYKSVFYSKIEIKKFLIFVLLFSISMGGIGVYRGTTSTSNFSFSTIFFNLFQEPLYTSFSFLSFIQNNDLELFKIPKFLLSSFINLIPSFVLPSKLDYVLLPSEFGYYVYNPLGAFSLFVSMMINFGILGSCFVLYFFGRIMSRLKYRSNSILSKTCYVMISGFLAFTFYRDGFETSIIKNIFEFSILSPIVIIISTSFISESIRKK